jgi:hypothetical protein
MLHYNSSCRTRVSSHKVGPVAVPIAQIAEYSTTLSFHDAETQIGEDHTKYQMQFPVQCLSAVLSEISDHLRFRGNVNHLVITQG